MNNNPPKISVCIPTYNYAAYLPEAIESVLSQNYGNFELLIYDDSSQDNTPEVVGRYAASDQRIVFKRHTVNLGMVRNWNLCLQEARGEYIKFLFGDDMFCSPDALRRMTAILDNDRNVALVASARNIIDQQSNTIKLFTHFQNQVVIDGVKAISRCLWEHKNLIGEPSAVMFRKGLATRGFDSRYRQLTDLEMWFHILEKGKFAYIRTPLCAFRRHPLQQTAKNLGSPDTLNETKLLLYGYLNKPYIAFGRIKKEIVEFDRKYQLWKLYKSGMLNHSQFMEMLEGNNRYQFNLLLLIYMMYRPFYRFGRMVRNRFM